MAKKTPLYARHKQLGGQMIDFGGWELPVLYNGIIKEHQAVRTSAGLFDVSHMGEVMLEGPKAAGSIQYLMTNDVSRLQAGQAMYTAMCDAHGGTVDDLIVYKIGDETFMLVLNAANTEKDIDWIRAHLSVGSSLRDVSAETALLALQGPQAQDILQKLSSSSLDRLSFFHFDPALDLDGVTALVSRTGYTGEDGFEIYVRAEKAALLWDSILAAGEDVGLQLCGLGARDTLRLEAMLPLYGQELSPDISPLEAGLGFAVKTGKIQDFIGRDALLRQKENGLKRRIVGIELTGRGIPRTGHEIYTSSSEAGGEGMIGRVTSGTHSPTFRKSIGLALLDSGHTLVGTHVEVGIRGKRVGAVVVKTPFYKRVSKK